MNPVDVIRKKRDGSILEAIEIAEFIHGATHHTWSEGQLAAMLMAIVTRGMNAQETGSLTIAMTRSGEVMDLSDLPGPKIDKHSTGGVGDKVSLVLAPLAAACGIIVPMMSGRGLGHTGGTLDKLEAIPGFRVQLNASEFRQVLQKVGCAMIGQTERIAPADKTLYALRDVTATVESIPLITASILSKKLAEGINGLVMDIKTGLGAFMKTLPEARELAHSIQSVAVSHGLQIATTISNMDAPLGRAVGNSLEVIEAIETLQGHGPEDLVTLSVHLTARMVMLAKICRSDAEAYQLVRQKLDDGSALEKFRQLIQAQGGDPKAIDDVGILPVSTELTPIVTGRSGYIEHMDAEIIGRAAMALGAGRRTATDQIHHHVGVIVRKKLGESVQAGQAIFDLYHHQGRGLAQAMTMLSMAFQISDSPPTPKPLILEILS